MENVCLVAGLGNPGRRYQGTRHNAGFLVLDKLASRLGVDWRLEKRFSGRLARVSGRGPEMFLLEPQTFMNASGESVGAVAAFYQIPPARILVVVDDADLPLGLIRLRPRGSNGGHHGLESVERHLGSREYARARIGIGRDPAAGREITDYVLSEFSRDESPVLEKVLTRACDQIECWFAEGIVEAMNRFNGTVELE